MISGSQDVQVIDLIEDVQLEEWTAIVIPSLGEPKPVPRFSAPPKVNQSPKPTACPRLAEFAYAELIVGRITDVEDAV